MNNNGYDVYIYAGATTRDFASFKTEEEAVAFCEAYGWEWVDENGFAWGMNYWTC